jgi:choline dehydrogenase-like flavoprotein
VHAKYDAEVLGVRPALEHDNVELLIYAEAVRLNTNAAGTSVTGVVINHAGSQETLTADLFVVSCGAANSARLLLMSASDRHPNGLANGSDQVGRNYMFHNSQAVLALSLEENPTVFQKTLGLNDFYLNGTLYVADTSIFPSIGAVNPALTAMANALRVGDRLLERMDARSGSPGQVAAATSQVPRKTAVVVSRSILR